MICLALVPLSSDFPPPDTLENIDLPITFRKDSIIVPKAVKEALSHYIWSNAMVEEIHAFEENHLWDLVDLHKGMKSTSDYSSKLLLVMQRNHGNDLKTQQHL
ncbi:hypothetical protein KY290_017301 [Solanum tuberosum]|uniref:Uncharacterized protein n=1 Tax=Solanum tuberosum TaxID=4113 RepID=A0ABQ7VD08_SOLTU|nr:hypothetical protein KY290_017301 [Solanum tuberosum]